MGCTVASLSMLASSRRWSDLIPKRISRHLDRGGGSRPSALSSLRGSSIRDALAEPCAPADEPHQEEQLAEGRDEEEAEVDARKEIGNRFHDAPLRAFQTRFAVGLSPRQRT